MRKKILWTITTLFFMLCPSWTFFNDVAKDLGEIKKGEVFAQENLQASVLGIWQAEIQSPFGNCLWEIILNRDGSFSKAFRCPNMMTYELGNYWVGQGFIRLRYTSHQPTEYKGRELHYPDTETIFFQFVDRNHIICEDRILGGKWHAYRVP